MPWTKQGNLRGPEGPAGTQGPQGQQGTRGSLWYTGTGAPGSIAGAQANDLYIDTANGDIYTFS